jgi:Leucine-rich repeat (LRR) protein
MWFWMAVGLLMTAPLAAKPPKPKPPKNEIRIEPNPIKVDARFIQAEKDLVAQLRKQPNANPNADSLLRLSSPRQGYASSSVAFSPSAGLIATVGPSAVILWDHTTGKELRELPGATSAVHGQTLAFSPDGKLLAVLDKYAVRVYKVETGQLLKEMPLEQVTWHVAFSADGSTLTTVSADAVGASSPVVNTYFTRTFARKQRLTITNARQGQPWTISPSGNFLVHFNQFNADYMGKSTSIVVIDLVHGGQRTFEVGIDPQSASIGWDDRTLYFTAWRSIRNLRDEEFHKLDLVTGETAQVSTFKGLEHRLLGVTTDGRHVLVRGTPYTRRGASLVETATGKCRWCTSDYPWLSFSPGGSLLGGHLQGGMALHALEDLLNPRWADLGEGIARANEKFKCEVTLYRDSVRTRFGRDMKSLGELTQMVPALTHLSLIEPQGLSEEVLAALRELPNLEELSLYAKALDDRGFAVLGKLKTLRRLNLSQVHSMTDSALESLKNLENLESLDLTQTKKISDEGMRHIGGMKSLRRLILSGFSENTEKGMQELARLDLRELTLPSRTGSHGSSLKHLGALKNLESLTVSESKLKEDDLKALSGMTKLRHLVIHSYCDIDDDALAALKDMTELRTLNIYSNRRVTGTGFRHLDKLHNIETLKLHSTAFSDEGLSHLTGMTGLTKLELQSTKITDAGLKHLAGLKKLRHLELSGTKVRGAGLQHLKDCTDIIELDLTGTQLNNEELKGLKGWANLRILKLPQTTTDAGLEQLDGLERLDRLDLTDCNKVTGPGLARLRTAAPRLRVLILSKTGLNDKSVRGLVDLTQVRELYLNGTAITAESLPELKGMTHLQNLGLSRHSSMTFAKVQELREALPKCWVMD